ncbi:MAG: substrate-binding domain-containing protein [Actinomyces urogenitalis]|uniref:Tat pathway signal sequence domain protein n=2 Tax=Actinomyces urogenitalis TaxID=103621 RepID=C0W8Q9_9ACTO|nr:substrate-binding domain-containing protein [Actinomyces urogenitalis]ETJ01739.1 MAG: Ribose ABC superfamily ATP binding cassette transporter, binding protein [Actinomyces urogenitalis DORA_12]EEH64888.1 Tat pathway signal sequence domain protein [Actinomyces urogenitalis DSM 15434]MBS5976969.1 substrate-binding domain-containing protein [Actinomyces urogenitalis]MBS6072227.1 substrate-binding domain-containing protein [Actinomyces urogenitalis]MDK8237490.1 substrate-binding domain-containi
MRRRNALGLAAVTALSAVGLAACSGSRAGEGGAGAGQSIAVVAKGYASPFWATVKAGAEAAGKDLGYQVSFNGPDSETDVPRQNDQLQQALVKHPRRSSSPRWTPRPRPPSCSSSLRPPSR